MTTAGSLLVVGLGPGPAEWLTPEAARALERATDIVGYESYLARVPARSDQRRHISDNRNEIDRARRALGLASEGCCVAVVSGGWHNPGEFPFRMEYCVTLHGGTVEYSSLGRPPVLFGAKGGSQVLELTPQDGYAAEIGYFAECCDAGKAPERCPPAESADAVKVMRLLLESRNRNGAKMICSL